MAQRPGTAKPVQRPQPLHPALRDLMRSLAAVAMCIVLAHLLAGCGGGDPEPDVLPPTVSCTAGACK